MLEEGPAPACTGGSGGGRVGCGTIDETREFPEINTHLLIHEEEPWPVWVRGCPQQTLPGHGDQGQASPSLPVCNLWLVLSATSGLWTCSQPTRPGGVTCRPWRPRHERGVTLPVLMPRGCLLVTSD